MFTFCLISFLIIVRVQLDDLKDSRVVIVVMSRAFCKLLREKW